MKTDGLKKSSIVLSILFSASSIYLIYGFVIPPVFNYEHTATVLCQVITAATVTTREDGGGEKTNRVVEVRCDYASAGAPWVQDQAGLTAYFNKVANEKTSITIGDKFVCTATWTKYKQLPFAFNARDGYFRMDTESCRLAPRT